MNHTREIKMQNISKSFYGTKALRNVDFTIKSGEVHALVGLNGAGKSTLIKVLGGIYDKDEGQILLDGKPIEINSPIDAKKYGISIIHQEYSLINELDITSNIFLGRELTKKKSMFIDKKKMTELVKEQLLKFDLDIDPNTLIRELNSGEKQIIEIIRSLMTDAWLIVMDEPTSALSEEDKERLFEFINKLKKEKIGIIYISHHMPEIFEIADLVTIMRDGQVINTLPIKDTNEREVIKAMTGEELKDFIKPEKPHIGDTILEVKNISSDTFKDISFNLRRGEILALIGLRGCGATDIARTVFGLKKNITGSIYYKGKELDLKKGPSHMIKSNIGFVSENRDKNGIMAVLSVKDNISLPFIKKISNFGIVKSIKERKLVERAILETSIKAASHNQQIKYLSGGNKQKVCFARWLDENMELIILIEPTRGIDVHAKAEIYRIIEALAEKGVAILLVSYEIDEVTMIADRVLVLYKGSIVSEYSRKEIQKEKILSDLAGVRK